MQRQKWYGSPCFDVWTLYPWSISEAMTAISMMYTMQRFIVAADGRCRSDDPSSRGERETDQAQKIFFVDTPVVKMAWALAGFASNEEGTFDMATECKGRIDTLPVQGFSNSQDYIHRLCLNIRRAVIKARTDGRIPEFPKYDGLPAEEKGRKFRLFFMGYFKGVPFWIETAFYHDEENDRIRIRMSHHQLNQPNLNSIGPKIIFEMMYRNDVAPDPRLARYRRQINNGELEYVISVIKAYADPVASEIDPQCKDIGGHIHAAEITPRGFRWLIEPLAAPRVA